MEEEKYAEEDDCDAPTDESISPPSLTQTPYQQLLSSQNVVNGSFNPEFLSAFSISLTEIPAGITSLTTDPDLQQWIWATLLAMAILEVKFQN